MMSDILSLCGVHKATMLLTVASNVIKAFDAEFQDDRDVKNAAIDALIDILQKNKNTTPTQK